MTPTGERLQKVLARAGVASRRAAEGLIVDGRVTVNGVRVTELGSRVDPDRDEIRVDGRAVISETPVYYALHKPPSVVTTMSDPEGRPSVGDLAKEIDERVVPVGRLDWDAEGLLLLTNDGALVHRLTHPRFGVRRTYDAKVRGVPDDAVLETLRAGVRLEDGMVRPVSVERSGKAKRNTWIRVVVAEGRPHLVKRLFKAVGHPVQRLRRVAYGPVELGRLPAGEIRTLTAAEVRALRDATRGGGER